MKRITCCLAICFMIPGLLFAQVDKFHYQPQQVKSGILYHYVKTNIDGSKPEKIAVYVAAPDRLEVFKYHDESPGSRAAFVIAWMDWKTFSVGKLESWSVTALDQKSLVAVLEYVPDQKSVRVKLQDKTEMVSIPLLPYHVYNFDLTSLNFALRHLSDPQASFKIGIADPNFAEEGPIFLYRGEVDITFVGEDKRNDVICRKYKLNGPGVSNRGGFIWVNRAEGHIEDMEMDLPDNPNWTSFKLALHKAEKMNADQWKAFMDSHFK